MIRLWLILGLVVFIVWVLYKRLSQKTEDKDEILEAELVDDPVEDKRSKRTLRVFLALLGTVIIVFLVLPKFGLHPMALLQKLVPMLGVLRNLLL